MSNNNTEYSGGIGLGGAVFIVFLVLKLTHTIDWSWWWVTAPLWIPFAIVFGILALVFLVVGIESTIKSLWDGEPDSFYLQLDTGTHHWDYDELELIKENKMDNVVDKIKNLTLSRDERLLRTYGLKDSQGEWTINAVTILDQMILEERKADLIDKVRQLDAEEKKTKK